MKKHTLENNTKKSDVYLLIKEGLIKHSKQSLDNIRFHSYHSFTPKPRTYPIKTTKSNQETGYYDVCLLTSSDYWAEFWLFVLDDVNPNAPVDTCEVNLYFVKQSDIDGHNITAEFKYGDKHHKQAVIFHEGMTDYSSSGGHAYKLFCLFMDLIKTLLPELTINEIRLTENEFVFDYSCLQKDKIEAVL